ADSRGAMPGRGRAVLLPQTAVSRHGRQVQQHRKPRGALDQGADGRTVQADGQIALPVPGHRPVLHLRRPPTDPHLVGDELLAASPGAGPRYPQRAPGAQELRLDSPCAVRVRPIPVFVGLTWPGAFPFRGRGERGSRARARRAAALRVRGKTRTDAHARTRANAVLRLQAIRVSSSSAWVAKGSYPLSAARRRQRRAASWSFLPSRISPTRYPASLTSSGSSVAARVRRYQRTASSQSPSQYCSSAMWAANSGPSLWSDSATGP